jgi:hypothetical protein
LARRTSCISSLTGCSMLGWMVLIRNLMQDFSDRQTDSRMLLYLLIAFCGALFSKNGQ